MRFSSSCQSRTYTGQEWSNHCAWLRRAVEEFSALLALCAGNSPVTSEFPQKDQWQRALVFSLIDAWTNVGVNNQDADGLRRHCAHCDVTVVDCSTDVQGHGGARQQGWQPCCLYIFKFTLAISDCCVLSRVEAIFPFSKAFYSAAGLTAYRLMIPLLISWPLLDRQILFQ